jgi:nucleotide-binding universal stress UspA family protein
MTVVVGHQATEEGRAALRHAAEEAGLRGRRLVVVTGPGAAAADPGIPEAAEIVEIDLPDPADRVLRVAQDADAELLVVGTRHRSAVGKFLLGSTARRIILEAACPVLVVKTDPS